MAKLSAKSTKPVSVKVSDHVRMVRARYAQALELGYSVKEATDLAHGSGPIAKPQSGAEPAPVGLQANPVTIVTDPPAQPPSVTVNQQPAVEIDGNAGSAVKLEDIPPNWQDLPWTNLKKLAVQVSGHSITSRKDAVEAITTALENGTIS